MSGGRSWIFRTLPFVGVIILAFLFGYFWAGPHQANVINTPNTADHVDPAQKDKKAGNQQLWTCSMHPQIKLPQPGKCPICYMDLIPLESDDHSHESDNTFVMSETAKKLAEVETSPVAREQAKVIVGMQGLVFEDETRTANLTARIDGRLDEVFINFTGVRVTKGDPMVTIWSPTLIRSQVELFETMRSGDDPQVLRGAEEKLIQYGLTRDQIEEIKQKKKPILNVTLRAPINGIVTRKMAFLGQFVKEGQDMYIINDLSHVWIKLDAYETDLPWIRYGQNVTFTTPAVPGRKFTGRVLFIDPVLDMKTRSVKIRVEAENPDFTLKPGMFVSAELESEVDSQGRIIKSEWAGKYICPVHPRDVASDTPGICPESKVAMQPASAFGYADDPNPKLPLTIPATAPLITGKRSIVYVEIPGDKPTYQLREVVLGPRAKDKYVVYEGLSEGEKVVSRGNFKIDSAMQILAKTSMMSPKDPKAQTPKSDEEVLRKIDVPSDFLTALNPVIQDYIDLKNAVTEADPDKTSEVAKRMSAKLQDISRTGLNERAVYTFSKLSEAMLMELKLIAVKHELDAQRTAFDTLSESFAKLMMTFRHTRPDPLFLFFCADNFDGRGAYWIDSIKETKNPYAQDKDGNLNSCAELTETIEPISSEVKKPNQTQGPPKERSQSNPSPPHNHGRP